VRYDPCNINAYNNLGNYKFATGEFQEAIVYYQKALECEPDFIFALGNLGKAYFELGDFKKAIVCFLEFTSKDSSNPHGHYMLGRSFYGNKQNTEAAKAFYNVLVLKPDHAGAAEYHAKARRKMNRMFEEVQ